MILRVENLTMRFGGVTAVNKMNLTLNKGEIVALIGPNGAGKTTAFNMITGVYKPTEGNIYFLGESGKEQAITGMRPDMIASRGIARTFQNIRLFRDLSVLENVLVACHLRVRSGLLSSVLHLPKARNEEREIAKFSEQLLKEAGLWDLRDAKAGSLPYGNQRRLEIARALATRPRLLLLDEPAAGMNPKESQDLTEFIRELREKYDLTVLLIEHHMQVVMNISKWIHVLEYGNVIAVGTPAEIQANPAVIKAYLGEE